MSLTPAHTAALTTAWQQAATALHIRVTAPFTFTVAGATHEATAHLPDFGGPQGLVLCAFGTRLDETDAAVRRAAVGAGYEVLLINAQLYARYDEDEFTALLSDADYTGPEATCPPWYG